MQHGFSSPRGQSSKTQADCLVRAHAAFLAGALLPSSLGNFHEDIDLILRAPTSSPLKASTLGTGSQHMDGVVFTVAYTGQP